LCALDPCTGKGKTSSALEVKGKGSALSGSDLGIGEVARRAGVRPSAIRYYEEVGLLAAPPRVGGKRRYDEDVFRCLANIEGAKRAGFTLGEMRSYFQCSRHGDDAQACHRALVRRKLEEVEGALSRLLQTRDLLESVLRRECGSVEECAALLSRR
jgi:MerR family redox-sensitive transcriptional activator SoxR